MNLKKKNGVLDERKIWTDMRISMKLKKKKRGFELTEDLDWYRNKNEFKEKKDGVLGEQKIWTDMRISMNLKKNEGVWTNGRFGLI